MSSPGPPPPAATFEASKCARIMARGVASSIETSLPSPSRRVALQSRVARCAAVRARACPGHYPGFIERSRGDRVKDRAKNRRRTSRSTDANGAAGIPSGARGTRTPDLLGAIQAACYLNLADLQG